MQRKYFLRANTSSGLVNLTENNLQGIENLYILCGKSKFLKNRILKNVAKFVSERERDMECGVSPFEISQLDSVILRDEKTAIIDSDCITEKKRAILIDTDDFISPQKYEKFKELGEYYNINSPDEIRRQLEENENILALLDELKPYLEETFSEAEYTLEMNFEPEMDDEFIILRLDVSKERFYNGIGDEIRAFELKIWNIEKRLNVLREVLIMPGIRNV